MGFGKLGPIQGHVAVATCRPSGSGRDIESLLEDFMKLGLKNKLLEDEMKGRKGNSSKRIKLMKHT